MKTCYAVNVNNGKHSTFPEEVKILCRNVDQLKSFTKHRAPILSPNDKKTISACCENVYRSMTKIFTSSNGSGMLTIYK